MSSAIGGTADVASEIRQRLDEGLRRIAFYIIPSAAAFLLLGDIIAGVLYQGGAFKRDGTVWVWAVLAGSAVGLLAGTMGRLYSSAWYAQRDTRTPLKFAMLRVALTFGLGYVAALRLPAGWTSRPNGASPASPRRQASPRGWSSGCCGGR